ncbi:hypothetical protein L204_102940 [Cryptococcus depauperatus]
MRSKTKKVKKQSILSTPRPLCSSVSHKLTQATIAGYHTLVKRKAILNRQLETRPVGSKGHTLALELQEVEKKILALGGLDAYQRASTLGQSKQRGGDTSKVLVTWLWEMGLLESTGSRLRMLEIGALRPDNFDSQNKYIDNCPIDLHSQHPDIVEQDFFERPLPNSDDEGFDIISCSLVLNFVEDPSKRGRMLQLMHSHLKPGRSSLLFLVLPLPCVSNSRYLTPSLFIKLMEVIGFELVKEQRKKGAKLGYWLWRRAQETDSIALNSHELCKKVIVHNGAKKNNFAILLPQ